MTWISSGFADLFALLLPDPLGADVRHTWHL